MKVILQDYRAALFLIVILLAFSASHLRGQPPRIPRSSPFGKNVVAICILSIAWVAFWTNFRQIADDLYVIRQHIENGEVRGAGVPSSESAGEESEG